MLPSTTANQVPSVSTSTAAAVAARASMILDGGWSIDPEQSTMMISALPPEAPSGAPGPGGRHLARRVRGDGDDRADVAPAYRQVRILVDVHGETGQAGHRYLLDKDSGHTGGNGASTAVMLSAPPASTANFTSATAAASGSACAAGSAMAARPAGSGR